MLKLKTAHKTYNIELAKGSSVEKKMTYSEVAKKMASFSEFNVDKFDFLKTAVDYELGLFPDLPYCEISGDGNVYRNGRLYYKDQKALYRPFVARGSSYDHGLFFQAFLDEIQIMRPWQDIVNTLKMGDWYAEGQYFEDIEQAFENIEGGFSKFVHEALTFLIYGFSIFEKVYCPVTNNILKLSFRYPNQVVSWIFDHDGRQLIAVELRSGEGTTQIVPVANLLILTYNGFGLDFEGTSPLRPILKYVALKDFLQNVQMKAAEKYGSPIWVLKTGSSDSDDDAELVSLIDSITAEDLAVLTLPDGREFEIVSAQGTMPDFQPVREYCDTQIAMALMGEGNLIGLNGTGSYALSDVTDDKATRQVPAYAKVICEALNGSTNTPYHGVVRDMIDAKYGPQDKYPKFLWAPKKNTKRSSQWFANVALAKEKGLITWSDQDEEKVRLELDLYGEE